MLLAADRFEL